MHKVWQYPTRVGTAKIIWNPRNDRWHIVLGDEDLGSYQTPYQALDDFLGGHTFSHSSGVDTSQLGVPDDLGEWTAVPSR